MSDLLGLGPEALDVTPNACHTADSSTEDAMRHTITVTVEVESDCEDINQVADALLGHITDMQDQHHVNSVVEPDGSEWVDLDVTASVAKAEALGIKIEAGWAVQ